MLDVFVPNRIMMHHCNVANKTKGYPRCGVPCAFFAALFHKKYLFRFVLSPLVFMMKSKDPCFISELAILIKITFFSLNADKPSLL